MLIRSIPGWFTPAMSCIDAFWWGLRDEKIQMVTTSNGCSTQYRAISRASSCEAYEESIAGTSRMSGSLQPDKSAHESSSQANSPTINTVSTRHMISIWLSLVLALFPAPASATDDTSQGLLTVVLVLIATVLLIMLGIWVIYRAITLGKRRGRKRQLERDRRLLDAKS